MDFLSSVNWAELGLKALAAIVILVVTAILAMAVKGAVAKLAQRIPALQKPGVDGAGLGASIGVIASMIVWLLGLIMVLGMFQLMQVLSPVVVMLESDLGYVPNIIGTVFVFIIGVTIAKIARALIRTALSAVDFGKLLGTAQSGIDRATGGATAAQHPACAEAASQPGAHHPGVAQPAQPCHGQPAPGQGSKVPEILSQVEFALIMIVVSIAALQILGIASISEPASAMLTAVFTAIPNIVAAVVLVALGVLIARVVSGRFRRLVESSGIDTWLSCQEILPKAPPWCPLYCASSRSPWCCSSR